MTIALAIALPGAALAQGAPLQVQGGIAQPYAAGVIHGRVTHVNVPQGIVILRSRQGLVRLFASPSQLAGLNLGDRIRLPYASYDGELWLTSQFGQSQFWGNYAQQVRFTGRLQQVNRGLGVIVVDGRRIRSHPAELQGVVPGDVVRIRAVLVGGVPWVTRIRPFSRAQIGIR